MTRCTNRISIFLVFIGIYAFLTLTQNLWKMKGSRAWRTGIAAGFLVITGFSLWMQFPPDCFSNQSTQEKTEEESAFVIEAEARLADVAQLTGMRDAGKISDKSRVLFVNDGSRDNTWEIIEKLSASDPHFISICLSRNRGHQNALTAGMMEAREHVDCIISIDADGQDDIHAMDAMIDQYRSGSEVVYGVRSSRETDTWFKRTTAQVYYRLLAHFGGDIVYNHADYRLVSSTVLDSFADFHEVNLFLRGLFPLIGYKSSAVRYERGKHRPRFIISGRTWEHREREYKG